MSQPNDTPEAQVVTLPRRWGQDYVDRVTGHRIPTYNSAEFHALPWDSPIRVASCVIAAESWAAGDRRPADVLPFSQSRAREIREARRPRPGDHPGGPVQWDGGRRG